MTYRQLLYKAQRLINHNEITLGEYDEMTKPLEEEVRKVGKWKSDGYGHIFCTACNEASLTVHKSKFCPYCGARMEGREND